MNQQIATMRHASATGGRCQHAARVVELEAEVAVLKRKLRHFAERELVALTTSARRSSTSGVVPAPPDMQRYIQAKRRGATKEAAMAEARI